MNIMNAFDNPDSPLYKSKRAKQKIDAAIEAVELNHRQNKGTARKKGFTKTYSSIPLGVCIQGGRCK